MVEFLVERDLLANLFKYGCITKTKGKGLIDTLRITVDNEKIVVEGIDKGYTIASCVRAFTDEVIEPGTFVYSPLTLLGKLQSFGTELSVRTDNEKIYVTDIDNVTVYTETLPNIEVKIPVKFQFTDVLIPENLTPKYKATVVTEPPKFDGNVVLCFDSNGFSVSTTDDITTFKKNLCLTKFEDELKVKLDGNYFNKIVSLIKPPFVVGANENVVYIYTKLEWGDVAYVIAPIV